jgi:hypothetical protein
MALHKKAVDSTAADYWTKYFGDYGRLWVRRIPRKIAVALKDKQASIMPLGHAVTDEGVALEGIAKTSKKNHIFCARFDHRGKLIKFETV